MKHTSEIHQMFVNQSLEMMQASFTLFLIVSRYANRLYTRFEFDADMQKFKARTNQTRNFENMVMSFYQGTRPEYNIESFFTSGKQKKIDCSKVDGYCDHCKTVFEAMGCYYHFCSCQEARPSLTDQDIERGNKKREMNDMRREYMKEKGYKIEEMWECDWWESFKTNDKIKDHVRTIFPKNTSFYRLPSSKNKRGISFWLRSVRFSCSR